jgi:uncharacterized coiled-coil protein SlyX
MNTEKEDGFFVCQHCGFNPPQFSPTYHDCIGRLEMHITNQAATIADLQQQLDEANRRGEELVKSMLAASNWIKNCSTPIDAAHELDIAVTAATSKRGG